MKHDESYVLGKSLNYAIKILCLLICGTQSVYEPRDILLGRLYSTEVGWKRGNARSEIQGEMEGQGKEVHVTRWG